jgi:hypothetical protein
LRENFNKIYENAKVDNQINLKNLSRDLAKPPLNVTAAFADVVIKGFSNFYFSDVKADLMASFFGW